MKRLHWTAKQIAQAYRDQGVPWSEDEIRAKADQVAREMARWDMRWNNQQRKFYRNAIPCGLANPITGAYDYAAIAAERERLRREDWTGEQRARRKRVDGSGQPRKPLRCRVPRLPGRRKTSRDYRRDERAVNLNGKECG